MLSRIYKRILRTISDLRGKTVDIFYDTRINSGSHRINYSYIKVNELDTDKIDKTVATYLSKMYLSHRFDLLGSGWVRNQYNIKPLGLEGYKYGHNLNITDFDNGGEWLEKILHPTHFLESKRIWKHNFDKKSLSETHTYNPIDWQKDFKSGFRWNQKRWYKDCLKLAKKYTGVDIKVPWELAQLKHLPQMAIFSLILPEYKKRLIHEFKNQMVDFITTNPPCMGVNWASTMEVGIRVANMLIAYDMFLQVDTFNILDDDFRKVFTDSVYQHGLHIINNLEYNNGFTSNHYLANLFGLLFVSAYFCRSSEIDGWLVFAVQEMMYEFKKQFYEDGSNFEASTFYHKLSTEIILYSTALVLGFNNEKKKVLENDTRYKNIRKKYLGYLDEEKFSIDVDTNMLFPKWFVERLFKAGEFILILTKPTGEMPQIGDNDSCSIFRLSPNGNFIVNEKVEKKYFNLRGYNKIIEALENDTELCWDENTLNQMPILSAIGGLFDDPAFAPYSEDFPLEKSVIEAFAKGGELEVDLIGYIEPSVNNIKSKPLLKYHKQTTIIPKKRIKKSLKDDLQCYTYPYSGIYIFRSDRIHLTIVAGPIGQNGTGGHAHNDKLSFELNIDGEDYFVDPGTYLYTPLINRRNEFRSTINHNTLVVNEMEQNRFFRGRKGMFLLKNDSTCELVKINNHSIILRLSYKSIMQEREFTILNDKIVINDSSNVLFQVNLNTKDILYSNGYGKLINKIN